MEEKHYYHVFANGDDAKSFVICEADFVFQFNLVGICAFVSGVIVLAFSIEESHPHFLLYGTLEQCNRFMERYRHATLVHIASTRGSAEDVVLDFEKIIIDSEDYLRNVAAYVIIQPTKDGKRVMYYDYKWGTGSMYFRPDDHVPLWVCDKGVVSEVKHLEDLGRREKQTVCSSVKLPYEWKVVHGLILPDNYIEVKMFESIFRTHNCFRVFAGAGKNQLQTILSSMASVRGVMMEDREANSVCKDMCLELFGIIDTRKLNVNQRVRLAEALRKEYNLSKRQLATLCRLPKAEIEKYLL